MQLLKTLQQYICIDRAMHFMVPVLMELFTIIAVCIVLMLRQVSLIKIKTVIKSADFSNTF